MGTAAGTVVGWRTRVSKKWYPTDGTWVDTSRALSVNCVVSTPTYDSGEHTENMFTTCIRIKTPNSSSIGLITSITIGFYAYDLDTTTGYMYGSLRTVDPDNGTSELDTLETYRTHVAGESSEQYASPVSYPISTYHMTFTGRFTKDTEYYLYLYTKSSNDIYQLVENSTEYTCSCEYSNSCTISFSAGEGSGDVPESITGYEGEYVIIGSEIPTPPANKVILDDTFDIKVYNDSALFGTHTASVISYTEYSFNNWQGGGCIVDAGGGITITGDITLVAQYNSNDVTEYSNNTLDDVSKTVGVPNKPSVTSNVPVLLDAETNGGTTLITEVNAVKTTEYIFKGWNTDPISENILAYSDVFTSAASIYAIYTPEFSVEAVTLPTTGVSKQSETISEYTVILNAGKGTVTPTMVTASRTRSYIFKGWGKGANATSYITSYTPTEDNETLYAIFDSDTIYDNPVTLPTPVRNNYAFLGWSTSIGDTSYVDNTYMPTSNTILYANYKVSNAIKMYIYSSGAWRRAKGHLCANNTLFNECVDT